MNKIWIYVIIIVAVLLVIFAFVRNRGGDSEEGDVDLSDLNGLSQDLNNIGNSVDGLNDNAELDSTGEASTGNLDEISSDLSGLDSDIGGLNDNTDL